MLIFIRHGEHTGVGKDPELTPLGRTMAAAAGAWLAEHGHRPGVLVATPWRRTNETARIVQQHSGGDLAAEVIVRRGDVHTTAELDAVAELAGANGVFVGHHTTQRFLASVDGATKAPRDNRCAVYVMERTTTGWRCKDYWPGMPKGGA